MWIPLSFYFLLYKNNIILTSLEKYSYRECVQRRSRIEGRVRAAAAAAETAASIAKNHSILAASFN
jgi:hypothetical protein